MQTVKVSVRGTITLPMDVRRRFAIKGNDLLLVGAADDGILLRLVAALPVEFTPK